MAYRKQAYKEPPPVPRPTLFVGNIHYRICIDQLKASLYELFSTYGEVIDLIASKVQGPKNKIGSAFIVYADISQATAALRALKDFPFYSRPLRIQYAKTTSDATAIRDGTYKPRKVIKIEAKDGKEEKKKRDFIADAQKKKAIQLPKGDGKPKGKILAEDLPVGITNEMLGKLFKQYPGFQSVEHIAGKRMAFMYFDTENQAVKAEDGLNGFKISEDNELKLKIAK